MFVLPGIYQVIEEIVSSNHNWVNGHLDLSLSVEEVKA